MLSVELLTPGPWDWIRQESRLTRSELHHVVQCYTVLVGQALEQGGHSVCVCMLYDITEISLL